MTTSVADGQENEADLVAALRQLTRPRFQGPRYAIIDTDHLLDLLKDHVHTGPPYWPSDPDRRFYGEAFASIHVYREIYRRDNLGFDNKFEKLARQADEGGWPTAADKFRSVFEAEYLPRLRFIDVTGLYDDSEAALAVERKDSHDKPTGQLIALLAGVERLVYSRDRAFRENALAPNDLAAALRWLESVELANSYDVSLRVSGGALILAVTESSKFLGRKLGINPWLVASVLVPVAYWALKDKARRDQVLGFLQRVGTVFQEAMRDAEQAVQVLAAEALPAERHLALDQAVAAVLLDLEPGNGLLAREIIERLDAIGYEVGVDAPALRTYLEARPCFVKVGRWHYGLGEVLGPPAS